MVRSHTYPKLLVKEHLEYEFRVDEVGSPLYIDVPVFFNTYSLSEQLQA
jgi:hypothetical protein